MPTTIDQAFIRQYESDAHEAYQRRGSKFRKCVRSKDNISGKSTTFQIIGKGVAVQKTRNGVIPPMNTQHSNVECILADWYAGDWSDKLDEAKTNIDEKRVLVNAGAFALGRRTDTMIMTEFDAAATLTPIATGGVGMTLSKVFSAMTSLGNADVFEEGRMYAAVPFKEWTDLLQIQQFSNADYVDVNDKPFMKGVENRMWLGTIWFPHSGLEDLVAASTSKSYWWHEDSVGHASGANVTTDITWHGDRAAWFVNNMMSQGSKLIDGNGIIEIQGAR